MANQFSNNYMIYYGPHYYGPANQVNPVAPVAPVNPVPVPVNAADVAAGGPAGPAVHDDQEDHVEPGGDDFDVEDDEDQYVEPGGEDDEHEPDQSDDDTSEDEEEEVAAQDDGPAVPQTRRRWTEREHQVLIDEAFNGHGRKADRVRSTLTRLHQEGYIDRTKRGPYVKK